MDLRLVLLLPGFLSFPILPALGQERPPQTKIIRKITVLGLKRLSQPSVVAKMKIRIGQQYDSRAVSEETGRLYKTGDFSFVGDPELREFEDGWEVVFTVVEKARVVSVRFDVRDTDTGKPSISQGSLRDEITSRAGGRLSAFALKVDADKIRRKYQEKGYAFAEVRTAVQEKTTGIQVTFIIDEGSRVRIQEITFLGNKTLESGDLIKVMETRPKDFFFGLIHSGYYDPEKLSNDVIRIKLFYASKGFFDAHASVDDLIFDQAMEELRIVLRVEEGPRYTFRGYRFEGNRVFPTSVLAALVEAPPGQPYDEELIQEDHKEIVKYYHDRAYIDATVLPRKKFQRQGTDVWIHFEIKEGNEVYIKHIHIRGNIQTKGEVIRRELEFYPEEKVNFSKFEKSRSNLARLQFFSNIGYQFEKGSPTEKNEEGLPREKKDVVVVVDEESTGRLNVGLGLSSGLGIIGNFSIHKRNFDIADLPESLYELPNSFTGAGQTMNIEIQPGTIISLYRVTFVEPYLFNTRNALTLRGGLFTQRRDDFVEGRASFTPRLGHAFDFDRDLVFSVGARLEEVEISDVDPNSAPDVKDTVGFTSIIALNAMLAYDKVLHDRWEGPFQGHREMVSYEYAGEPLGGDISFHKPEASLNLYFPLYVTEENQLHHVLSFFSRFGLMEGHHDTESIPLFERFFLGGPNSVRGFEIRGLGPHYGDDALGGTAMWYGNAEYAFPLFQKYLRGVVFFDYGNMSSDFETFDLDQMRLVYGGGIRINFPFLGSPLPIGLYLGHAFKREDSDKPRVFLFSIGWPF